MARGCNQRAEQWGGEWELSRTRETLFRIGSFSHVCTSVTGSLAVHGGAGKPVGDEWGVTIDVHMPAFDGGCVLVAFINGAKYIVVG